MIALALAIAPVDAAATDVYTCEYLATEAAEPHTPPHTDLVVRDAGGAWSVEWPGKAPIAAETFPANFGSIGGSVAFRWTESDGRKQTAFISFSDIVSENGSKMGWLSLGKPSLWQAPGYACATLPLKSKKDAK